MNPTPEEKQWLLAYLRDTMTYRETSDEAYEHILIALEPKQPQKFFEGVVMEVISQDFADGLNSAEEDARDTLGEQVGSEYSTNLLQWLKFPYIICTVAVFILATGLYLLNVVAAAIVFLFVFLTPAILIIALGTDFSGEKGSIKVPIYKKLIFQFIRLYFFCIIVLFPMLVRINNLLFHRKPPHNSIIFKSCSYAVVATFLTVHALSLFQAYKKDVRPSLKYSATAP